MSQTRPIPTHLRRGALVPVLVALLVTLSATAATAQPAATQPAAGTLAPLAWTACGTTQEGTAAGVQCARAALPLDYDRPDGAHVSIAVARVPATDQAHRIGSLFFNFGGPGASSVDFQQSSARASSPRSTGGSTSSPSTRGESGRARRPSTAT